MDVQFINCAVSPTVFENCGFINNQQKNGKYQFHRKQCNEGRFEKLHLRQMYYKDIPKSVFVFTFILLFLIQILSVCGQTVNQNIRPFPPLFNAAQNRPILTEPSQGTCGVQERSAFCKSSIFPISVDMCNQDFCVQQCPGREELPSYLNLLVQTAVFSDCVFLDTKNTRPQSAFQSASTSFLSSGPKCFVTPTITPDFSSTQEFTMTVWIWQKQNNNGTLIQKVSNTTGEIIFELNIRQSILNFVYKSTLGLLTVAFPDKIPPETWTHVAIQVYGTSLSFFLNGLGPGYSATHTVMLVSQVQETGASWVRVGLTLSGTYQFLGRLQDFRFYPVTLSNREIAEDYSNVFPSLRVQSNCRCPASHPRVKPLQVHYCIKNGEPDNTNDDVLRLNTEAHPLDYVNDGDVNSIWISDFMNNVNLVVDLGDEFQVFYVVLLFYSPLPMSVEIERKKDGSSSSQWETWQQFASDCQLYFNTLDDGPLPTPASTNCLRISTDLPEYSKGNITFNILNPEPVPRPGYNDFYHTPELFEFVSASSVRVKLSDHFFVTNERHRYYGLYDYTVIARCECHGHASTCEHSTLPYQCNCLPESHTQERKCNECQPLYNDKPFHRGDQIGAYSCRPCECYSHAKSCIYNATLDLFPDDHYAGGGGVCVNCQHNTEGRYCETCIPLYYRPTGKSMFAEDVCNPCQCFIIGVSNLQMDCAKEGGQCMCKGNVESRQCDTCMPGYFNLTGDNVDGCQECSCMLDGTISGDSTCDAKLGQCNCKVNVRGLKCESCQYGFFLMNVSNPEGCQACNCNPFGSTNQYCEPLNGQCLCKVHVTGRQCNECEDGYWAFEDGCLPCNCNPTGTEPPSKCDKNTGQCVCKANTKGLKCDVCKDETFGFGMSPELGCVACTCNPSGTVNGSMLCDKGNGDCVCRANVQGASCNQCKGNTWGLNMNNTEGCIPCKCDLTGTQLGDKLTVEALSCHQNTGQCTCLSNRVGRQCDDCLSGYHVSLDPGGGCLNCQCNNKGTLPLTQCHSKTGQCECRRGNSGVTGLACDECLEGYYGFNGREGVCQDCDCSTAGSVNYTCDPLDGQCYCKEFTWKRRCDRCVSGSSFLEEINPYGCSKAPTQQPPPSHKPLSSTTMRLTWKAPDYPNGLIEQYRVIRNGTLIFSVAGDERTVVDMDLQPFTIYSYVIEATNAFGSVQSSPISFRTPAGAPYGVVILNATDIQAKSVKFSWIEPQIMNGPLWKYVLYSWTEHDPTRIDQWEGQELQITLTSLIPFTNYIFHVDSCTTGGCLTSEPVMFTTMSAVPEGMSPPVVLAINNTALHISWIPPDFPNGIIILYELWIRGSLEYDGTRNPPDTRIFHPSGQFNPRPTKIPQENALPPPDTEYILTGLKPFTIYEFQVLAENSAGKSASPWVSGRTGASTPVSAPPPTIISISPFTLNVTWVPPADDQSRGIILVYRVYYYTKTNLLENPFAPPFMWKLMYETGPEHMFYLLGGLSPYTKHMLIVEACNSVGCINSTESIGRTQQDRPEGLTRPLVDGLNSSSMDVAWSKPAFPNGPLPFYTLQKTTPALSFPPQVIQGTRFPGGGYYLFPPNTIPPNVDFTGIRFWFRTRKRDGLLLFAASEGNQKEFVALQFKAGRPWFLFDPQDCGIWVLLDSDPNNDQVYTFHDGEWHFLIALRLGLTGCASFVTPTNDEGLPYNDNTWHQMIAWRDQNVAYISIDNTWTGSRTSGCAKGTVIGPNTGVYVGGLPTDFEIRRTSSDPRLKMIDHSFQGCIRDIQVMQQKYPTEVWKTLDWNDAIHNELAFLNWEGCPINLDRGVHFMGQGFARFPQDLFQVGNSKLIEFGFRTQMHTGILFFAYGGTGIYIYCALIKGALHFEFANGIMGSSVTMNIPSVNFCDSQWYEVELIKTGQEAKIIVKNVGTEVSGDSNTELTVLTSSEFYVGGIPPESEAQQFVEENKLAMPIAAFGGCIKDITFDTFNTLEFLEETIEVVNMNMDGCTPYHVHADTCKDDLITEVYNGTDMHVFDIGLQPYTDYLYRVLATNDAGAGKSPWGYGRTKEGSPIGVTPPYEAKHYNGFLVEFKWLAPVSTAGLLVKLVIKAYNLDDTNILPVEALFTNTSKREGNITDMIPYTNYAVMMLACTNGGCSESPDGFMIRTFEEAPGEVPAPKGISGPTYIYVTWEPPAAPNGVLTGYFLYMDGTLIYTGGGQAFNVTIDLQVYTSYVFYLKACTQVGCTEGPTTTLSTSQLPPKFVKPPTLTALGTSTVEARWETPEQLNGVLERYLLYASTESHNLGNIVYNSSDFFLDYIITNLIAGTTYYITLGACTSGGCTESEPTNITTEESAPGLLRVPVVTSSSPSQLHVEWEEPGMPNGEIINYALFHNEVPVYSGLKMFYDVGGLLPYSLHFFRIVACTKQGCSSSSQVRARTQESQPEGFVVMEVRVDDARTVSVKWTVPEKPNGNMYFDIYFEGLFYTDPGAWDYSTYHDRHSLHRSKSHNQWVALFPLLPMSSYKVQVNASNTVGYIVSNILSVDMPLGSPDGVKPPSLLSQTPTTVTATWIPVGRENSVDEALFILQYREKTEGAFVENIFGPTTSFTYTKENLVAYKEYEFRLVAENSNGATRSDWVSTITRQDRPAGFNTPQVVGSGPRYIDLVWEPPITANGILTEYKVYQNGQYRESTEGNVTLLRAEALKPYTYYTFVIEVCTSGGCTRSSPSTALRTLEDYPEDVIAPNLVSLTPASVELTWEPPLSPNGVISLYTLERRLAGKVAMTTVVSLSADIPLKYVDDDSTLTPHSEYEYRLMVSNGAGDGFSAWETVMTMSSRPAGVKVPVIQVMSPTVMYVSWEPPLQPNGVIEFYTVRLPEPQIEIRNLSLLSVLFEDLEAYTEYSVTVTACTSGGCTQSFPINVRTHAMVPGNQLPPVATPVSQSMISIVWQGPGQPNGPNIRYELSKMIIRQPFNPTVNVTGALWKSIYAGTGTFFEDRGLPLYTTYRYRLTVYNDIGQLTSDATPDVTTFGGFPRRAAVVTATPISHTAIGVSWLTPTEVDLQGSVKRYTVKLFSNLRNYTHDLDPSNSSMTFLDLTPNTQYYTTVTITIHGGAYITSDPIYVTTLDGAPEGVDQPTLSIVSETAIRVSWMAPEKPNGQITGYNIYNNGEKRETGLVIAGSYVLTGLQPYTVYEIQLEVCTVFDCVKSDKVLGSTLEALPQNMASPRVLPLSPYQISVMWQAPLQSNGIILRYDLWRRQIKQCAEVPKVTVSPEMTKCTYIQCGILQNLCGSTCYSGAKVCCNGVLHDSEDSYQCCGTSYAKIVDTSDVCCGGKFHPYRQNYQCCNNRYEKMLPRDRCCPDDKEDRISVGRGDECCGTVPYSTEGAQICCGSKLHDRHDAQCCGGEIVLNTMVCCGGRVDGHVYTPQDGWSCCGQQYIQNDRSLCCTSDTGHVQVHQYSSAGEKISANQQCCGIEAISNVLSCCNFVGYNPVSQYCADISHQQSGCGTGTVCSRTQKDTAFCDICDFDPYTNMCGSINGYHNASPTPTPPNPSDNCVVAEKKIYTGLNTDALDEGLMPYSLYEYSVTVVNSAGSTSSDYTKIKTLQARPEGLAAPTATLDPKQLYIIFLSWKLPKQPNGEILRFILVRDGIELYHGLNSEFRDDTTILPYKSYSYVLTVCTVAGCISSPSITVATAQAAPEGISPPKLLVQNATTLLVSWSPPDVPNGIIDEYRVIFIGDEYLKVFNTTELSLIIRDLLPYTRYNASLTVCTEMACTNSTSMSVVMPEDAPVGQHQLVLSPILFYLDGNFLNIRTINILFGKGKLLTCTGSTQENIECVFAPEIIVRSSSSVDVYWSAPNQSNGEVIFYALLRSEKNNEIRVFLGEDFHATDYNLVPGRTYMYFIITGTKAGNASSEATSVTMPDNTPSNIPKPHNVTVISATQIYVEWEPVPPKDGVIDQYRVLLNAGRQTEVDRGVGLNTFVNIEGLMPYTEYEVRIQACLAGVPNGCGTGPVVVVKTFEAAPKFLDEPITVTEGPNIVDITWKPPRYPNGIITQYLIYYRETGSSIQLLINRVSSNTYHIRHAGSELSPFTEYEYKIVAGNSQGDVSSPWSLIRTKAAPPTGLPQPFVTVTGAFSLDLKWVPPAKPNGIIMTYSIIYHMVTSDPTLQDDTEVVIVDGSLIQTSVSGLQPYSDYQLKLIAFNYAGNVSSIWTKFKTGESSPSGLGLFDIEKIKNGISVILRWGTPVSPNGIVTTYRIYEEGSSVAVFQGLNQEFELRRLEPYREYSVQLEACTTAGCTLSFSQSFFTAETTPTGQPSPIMGEITSDTVTITWVPPSSPNGKILLYEIHRRTNSRIQKRSVSEAVVAHRTTDTDASTFSYKDTNLQSYTEYQYSITASNSKGSTTSSWQSAFTSQAPPGGLQPPKVTYVSDKVDALHITWMSPDQPNGILQSYQLQRNDSVSLSFTVLDEKQFTDIGLNAFTFYSYTITVCSGGGCTTSEQTTIRTKESAPLKVSPPTLFAVDSTSLRITWKKPQIATGEISAYQLHINGIVVYEGLALEFTAQNLIPFTDYIFKLTACTTGGCTDSGEVTGKPDDDPPKNMSPPILRVMSSRSIEISWKQPEYPNGIITSYDVKRNGRLIYTESISVSGSLRTSYTDYNLDPGMEYAYVVIARNRKGSAESQTSVAQTFASSPAGLDPPTLSALSSTSIQVTWTQPVNPNGDIKNYTLYRDGEIVYSGEHTQLNYIVPGMQFWTEYSFRIQACTERGCTLSTGSTGRTLASRPEEQGPPTLLALANYDGAHSGVLIEWDPPQKPNGLIQRYEVNRREVITLSTGLSYGPAKMIYNGSALTFTDRDAMMRPFTDYEFSVTAINNVGKASSVWSGVSTKEAPPDAVPAPVVNATTPSTISVIVKPPSLPNGVVRYYNVLVNGTVASSSIDLYQTVGRTVPLLPYRFYAIMVQACTAGGCTTSPPTIAQTGTAKPSGQEPVQILSTNSTAVKLGWSHPTSPNGKIKKFLLYQRSACPPTSQPYDQSCLAGEPSSVYKGLFIEKTIAGLTPYTAYDFQIQSVNEAGPIDFPVWVRTHTMAEVPLYMKYPILWKNGSMAIVDWSRSFLLNSKLTEYQIIMDGNTLYRGVSSIQAIQRTSPSENLIFKLRAVTETGQVESPTIVFDPNAVDNIGTTPVVVISTSGQKDEAMFYTEVWFIALIVVVGVLLLLILLGCCTWRCSKSHPYIRERLPLQKQSQQKKPFTFMVDTSDGSLVAMDSVPHTVDRSGYYSGSVSNGVVNPAYANHFQKKRVSIDRVSDSMFGDDVVEEDEDDFFWDKNQDSGLVSTYDSESIDAPSYSITKEQTVFADTHL